MMRLRFGACVTGAVALMWAPAVAQAPTADEILALGTEFALRFFNGLTNVMAEERYVQETTSPRQTRVLRSDFYMVRYPGAEAWMAFRDVFEMDGKPVRPQDERLTQLFVDPPRDALARASAIAREGARYNLRDIGTLNNPLFVMALLQPEYRRRFRFTVGGREQDLGPDARTIRFEEWMQPTLLRGESNSNLPVDGLIWIDEKTGRVLKTQLDVGPGRFPAEIVTTFRFDASLGTHVPAEMRDWYPDATGGTRGVATYTRFRTFTVTAREEIGRPLQ